MCLPYVIIINRPESYVAGLGYELAIPESTDALPTKLEPGSVLNKNPLIVVQFIGSTQKVRTGVRQMDQKPNERQT